MSNNLHSCIGDCLLKDSTIKKLISFRPAKQQEYIIQLLSFYKSGQILDFIATILVFPNEKRDYQALKDEIYINIDQSDFDQDLKKSRQNFAKQHNCFLKNELENLYHMVNSLALGEDDRYITKLVMELVQYHALTLDKAEKSHFKNIIKNNNFDYFGITRNQIPEFEIKQ